jgi:Flp pilus assembly protein TadG
VELALVTPLLLVALAIPFDFGIALFMANLTQNAAREGTRIGAELQKTGGSDPNFNYTTTEATTVKNAVLSRMPNNLTSKTVNVKFYEGTAPTCVEYVQVTAQGNYNFFLYQLWRLRGFGLQTRYSLVVRLKCATPINPLTIRRPAQRPASIRTTQVKQGNNT